jgi:hypothetical protein
MEDGTSDVADERIERISSLLSRLMLKLDTGVLALAVSHGALIKGLVASGEVSSETAIMIASHIERALSDLATSRPNADAGMLLEIAELHRDIAREIASGELHPAPRPQGSAH